MDHKIHVRTLSAEGTKKQGTGAVYAGPQGACAHGRQVVGQIVSDLRSRHMVKWGKLPLQDSGKFCEASTSNHLRDKTLSAIKSKGNCLEEM